MDRISDTLTRIRNANTRGTKKLFIPHTKLVFSLCKVMKDLGFFNEIWERKVDSKKKGFSKREIGIKIKYSNDFSMINEIRVVSKPSREVFMTYYQLKKLAMANKKDIFLVSTSTKGVLDIKQVIEEKVGGKVLCYIN